MKWFSIVCSSKKNLGPDPSGPGINMEQARPRKADPAPKANNSRKKARRHRKNADIPNSLGRGLDELVNAIVERVEAVANPDGETTQRELRGSLRRRHNTACLDRFR